MRKARIGVIILTVLLVLPAGYVAYKFTMSSATIVSRDDGLANGPHNKTLYGYVNIPPGYVEDVSILSNGSAIKRNIQLIPTPHYEPNIPAEPGEIWSLYFRTEVRLPGRVNHVELAVTDTFGFTRTTSLYLDGDRLPDNYERDVTETDPLDPDSDSLATPRNEANNGTIDGHEDFDQDRMVARLERKLESDPLDSDMDNDGLLDGYEVYVMGSKSDRTVADSDGDGVLDGDEDRDGDGLTNAEEQDLRTNPHQRDSDGDGLSDPKELELGLGVWNQDSDGDGFEDGLEYHSDREPYNDPFTPAGED